MNATEIPRLVHGRVTRHEHYGFYVDFGGPQEGVVVITMIMDDPDHANPEFPAIGDTIDAVLLGFTEVGGQPRLSVKPSEITKYSEPR